MNSRHKASRHFRFSAVICIAVITVTALILTVYGAFTGLGKGKGVITGDSHYFLSDILPKIDKKENAQDNTVLCSSPVNTFQIRNYDDSTGAYNGFNITYDIYCWLADVPSAELYDYSITSPDNVTQLITADTGDAPVFSGVALEKGKANANQYTVTYTLKEGAQPDTGGAAGICIAAVPTTPTYMKSDWLGAVFKLSSSEFDIKAGFNDEPKTIDELAAFIYSVSASGNNNGKMIRISWNTSVLETTYEFDSEEALETSTDADDIIWKSCVLPAESFQMTFYRKPGTQITNWDTLKAAVKVQVETE